jgi:hypothetical protein
MNRMAGFEVRWLDEAQSICIWDFPTTYTLEEMGQSGAILAQMLNETAAARVDIILLMNRSETSTQHNMLSQISRYFDQIHPKVGKMIFVGSSMFTALVLKTVGKLNAKARQTIDTALSVDEALSRITAERSGSVR